MSELTNALSPLFVKGDDEPKKTATAQTDTCWLCDDCDTLYQIVCYLPTDNGGAKDIPIHHCPVCGKQLEEVWQNEGNRNDRTARTSNSQPR